MTRSLVVIGAGKFAADCIRSLLHRDAECVALVVDVAPSAGLGASLSKFCQRQRLACIRNSDPNDPRVREAIAGAAPDLCLSLNNFSILKPPLLAVAREGVINFHNGPLPRYAGVNVCSWAIINGEREYGVTLHFVDEGIDTGDIVAQRHFSVEPGWTAVDLTRECIRNGVELFRDTSPALLSGPIPRRPQPTDGRSYFGRRDTPNDGRLDFATSGYQALDRIVRGLRFYPFDNAFVPATCQIRGRSLVVLTIEPGPAKGRGRAAGTVEGIEQDAMTIACADRSVIVTEVLDDSGEPVAVGDLARTYGIQPGDAVK